ncbi:MAG: MaoC family dehydratase N-terminal domain-containing protein [Sphingomonadales bacterium]|nr:MaoC family dehydratase N-terminal domain-containing protein [Sphingomonadales bacterium]
MIDPKWIGVESETRHAQVEAGQLRLFAKATGETNPIFFDDEAARVGGYPALPAPPTFLFGLSLLHAQQRGGIGEMEIDLGKILHGEQDFTYHRMVHAGDSLRFATRNLDIYQKKGGALEFVEQETLFHNQDDELCLTARTVLVVRH